MREILFRGVETDREEWVYGYLIHDSICNSTVPYIGYLSHEQADTKNRDIVPVIPETVGQFTGLTDKNGKKIFEGDIVKVTGLCPDRDENKRIWRKWRIGEVFYYHGSFYFGKWLLSQISEKLTEVIGNIHDNPELLEAGK